MPEMNTTWTSPLVDLLFEEPSVGRCLVAPDGRVLRTNSEWLRSTGFSLDDVLGANIIELFPETRDLALAMHARARAGKRVEVPRHAQQVQGRETCWEGRIEPVPMEGGTGLLITAREATRAAQRDSAHDDLTERKRIEEALRESEDRYRWMVESHVAGFALHELIFDGSGVPCDYRFLQVNSAFERLTGLKASDIIGRTVLEVMPGTEPIWIERYGRVVQTGVVDHFASISAELDRHFEVTAYPGGPGRFAAMFTDITERKRMEAQLRVANDRLREEDRRKSEFLAVLSHELRNPLAPIRNSLFLLDRALPGSDLARSARDVLHRQTDHLTRLVEDLLDLTRISHGKITLQAARIDARQVARRACDDIMTAFEQRGVELQYSEPTEPAWVDADAARLAQMVGNLVSNALKFTEPGGQVKVAIRGRGPACEISVWDTGMGIERADLERIFEPFVQAGRVHAGAQGGLGIGLALVKDLADKHGGSVRAESAGLGQGAEFVLTLPLVAAPVNTASEVKAGQSASGLSVLVVEDNVDAGLSLADVLGLNGHQVKVVGTGRAGIESVSAHAPAVLICDVGLPDLSGYEVVRTLRAAGSKVFAVALTGFAQPEDRDRALEAGFDAHLAKPAALDKLNELITKAARKKR
jgi:PAS domain S-box-containing protein